MHLHKNPASFTSVHVGDMNTDSVNNIALSQDLPETQATLQPSARSLKPSFSEASAMAGSVASPASPAQGSDAQDDDIDIDIGGQDELRLEPRSDCTPSQSRTVSTPVQQISTQDVMGFLESQGLWDEARAVRGHAPHGGKAHGKGKQSASSSSEGVQHYMLRALRWVVEAESVAQLVEQMHLSPVTADEKAVQTIASASRSFVPALRQLRDAATDRDVLERLASGKNRSLVTRLSGDGDETSDGESSACDFGVSDASSGEEHKGQAPLVLPPSWKSEVVRRGKTHAREYIDGAGNRYKSEQQARRVIDATRRAANMTRRLRQRIAEQRTNPQVTPAAPVETPDEKRLRTAGRMLFGLVDAPAQPVESL